MVILLADDHPIIQVGLQLKLAETMPDAQVLLAESFPDVLRLVTLYPVDLIVLDIDIPGSANSQMMPLIKEHRPNVLIMMYSGLEERVYALPYIKAGADGFLSKNAPFSEFAVAIGTLLKTGKYISRDIQQLWLSQLGEQRKNLSDNPLQRLSKGEQRVLSLLTEGKWTKDIAATLQVKETTVSTYKKKIFEKLDVTTTTQLIQKINQLKHL